MGDGLSILFALNHYTYANANPIDNVDPSGYVSKKKRVS